jgi:type I restriction enzyme S subunit
MAIPIPAPPDEEQDEIVAHVRDNTMQLDEAVRRSRSEIDLIREYRTRLTADVVTGKLDVRGVAVPEVEEEGASTELDVAEDDLVLDDEALINDGAT